MDHYGYFVKWVFLLLLKCRLACDCLSQPVENVHKEFAFSLPHDFMKFRHFELFLP